MKLLTSNQIIAVATDAPVAPPPHDNGALSHLNLWLAVVAGIGAITVAPIWAFFKEKDRQDQELLQTLISNLIKRDAEFHAAIVHLSDEIKNLSSKIKG